jgi:hypothetical protein
MPVGVLTTHLFTSWSLFVALEHMGKRIEELESTSGHPCG